MANNIRPEDASIIAQLVQALRIRLDVDPVQHQPIQPSPMQPSNDQMGWPDAAARPVAAMANEFILDSSLPPQPAQPPIGMGRPVAAVPPVADELRLRSLHLNDVSIQQDAQFPALRFHPMFPTIPLQPPNSMSWSDQDVAAIENELRPIQPQSPIGMGRPAAAAARPAAAAAPIGNAAAAIDVASMMRSLNMGIPSSPTIASRYFPADSDLLRTYLLDYDSAAVAAAAAVRASDQLARTMRRALGQAIGTGSTIWTTTTTRGCGEEASRLERIQTAFTLNELMLRVLFQSTEGAAMGRLEQLPLVPPASPDVAMLQLCNGRNIAPPHRPHLQEQVQAQQHMFNLQLLQLQQPQPQPLPPNPLEASGLPRMNLPLISPIPSLSAEMQQLALEHEQLRNPALNAWSAAAVATSNISTQTSSEDESPHNLNDNSIERRLSDDSVRIEEQPSLQQPEQQPELNPELQQQRHLQIIFKRAARAVTMLTRANAALEQPARRSRFDRELHELMGKTLRQLRALGSAPANMLGIQLPVYDPDQEMEGNARVLRDRLNYIIGELEYVDPPLDPNCPTSVRYHQRADSLLEQYLSIVARNLRRSAADRAARNDDGGEAGPSSGQQGGGADLAVPSPADEVQPAIETVEQFIASLASADDPRITAQHVQEFRELLTDVYGAAARMVEKRTLWMAKLVELGGGRGASL